MIPASAPAPPDIGAAFNAAMARTPLRLDPRWYPSLTSTMDVVEEAAQAGAPEGLVIVADEQTQGRGRLGRQWHSPPGAGVYLSFVFRPPLERLPGPMLGLVTLAAGAAVRQAIARATGFAPDLKWPNDLTVSRRKLAGILAEGMALGTPSQTVLLGVGINVLSAAYPAEIAARTTSLQDETGSRADRARVIEEVLVSVAEAYDRLRRGETDDILRAWREAAPSAVGSTVEWSTPDGLRRGITQGIDPSGALLVRTDQGVERIVAGELKWV